MITRILIACLAMCVGGCASQIGRPLGMDYLRAAASSDYVPVLGADYWHPGKNISVVQVVRGGVLAIADVGAWERKIRQGDAGKERLVIFIETNDPYVDDEPVKRGVYKFTGAYQYITVTGSQKTVRRFKKTARGHEEHKDTRGRNR